MYLNSFTHADPFKNMEKLHNDWREHSPVGLMTTLGPLLSKKQDDGWLYGLSVRDAHLNPAGVVHGGMISTLMDHVFSAVCWTATEKRPCVTVQLNINFLKPAHKGDLLVVTSKITHKTRSLIFVSGDVAVSGQTIATGQGVLKALDSAPQST